MLPRRGVSGRCDAAVVLTPHQLAVLEFARRWEGRVGAMASAIRAELDLARSQQVLSGVLETRDALEHDAVLVNRLRRARDSAAARRAARRL